MTGIAAASFFSNTCRFGGCGLHFPTLADLIEHIDKDISFSLEKGESLAIIGSSGSGKTTLIKLINGLLTADGGSILIGGEAPGVKSKAMISYLPI